MVHPSVAALSKEERTAKLTSQVERYVDTRVMNNRVTHRAPHDRFELYQGTTLEYVVKFKLPKKLGEAMAKARKDCAVLNKKGLVASADERVRKDRLFVLKCISVDQINYFDHFVDQFIGNGGSMNPSCKEVSDFFYKVFVPHLFDFYGVDMNSGDVKVPTPPALRW